jgi:hypothetical protein
LYLFPRAWVKRSEREGNHSFPSNDEVKPEWSYATIPTYGPTFIAGIWGRFTFWVRLCGHHSQAAVSCEQQTSALARNDIPFPNRTIHSPVEILAGLSETETDGKMFAS